MAGDDLYFMRCREFVKIGRSRDPHHRRATLQLMMPFKIEDIIVLTGKGDVEREWHKRFADKRVRGEWFEWCQEISDAIEFAQTAPPYNVLIEMMEDGRI